MTRPTVLYAGRGAGILGTEAEFGGGRGGQRCFPEADGRLGPAREPSFYRSC